MALITADFERGVSGNNVATADAGSAIPYDTVQIGTGSTAQYDSTHAVASLSGKFGTGSTSTTNYIAWSTALGTVTDHYGRAYIYLAANPTGATVLIRYAQGASLAAGFSIATNGTFHLRNSANTDIGSTTNALSTGVWVRVEWHIIHSTTVGQIEVKLYNTADSTTATETLTTAATQSLLTSADSVRFGASANANFPNSPGTGAFIWYDNIVAGAASYPGPAYPNTKNWEVPINQAVNRAGAY